MKKHSIFFCIAVLLFYACTAPEKKEARDEQLCFMKITQGEMIITDDDDVEMLIDSLVMNLHIKNDSVRGVLNWLPAEKDKMTGTVEGTVQGDIVTVIYTYTAEGVTAKEEKIMRLDSNKVVLKTGELEQRNGVWVLKDKTVAFTESIPKTLCRD